MNNVTTKTTVAVSKNTKAKMDKWRAPGQCYDGFLREMIGLWERMHGNTASK
jgi:hypothetical protein